MISKRVSIALISAAALLLIICSYVFFLSPGSYPSSGPFPLDISRAGHSVTGPVEIRRRETYDFYLVFYYKNQKEADHLIDLIGGKEIGHEGQEAEGISVPINLRITDTSGQTIYDETVLTSGEDGAAQNSFLRYIGMASLKPGRYIIKATTTQNEPEFIGIRTDILISYRPNWG